MRPTRGGIRVDRGFRVDFVHHDPPNPPAGPNQPGKALPSRYASGRMARTGMVGLTPTAHHPVATRAVRGMAGLPGLEGPEWVILARLRAW